MIVVVFLAGFTKETTPMAHEEFDLSGLLDALRAGGDIDVIRRSVEMVLQALIDAEAMEVIGPAHTSAPTRGSISAMAAGHGCCRRRPAMSSWRSRRSARAASSRRCWSDVAGSTGPCSRW